MRFETTLELTSCHLVIGGHSISVATGIAPGPGIPPTEVTTDCKCVAIKHSTANYKNLYHMVRFLHAAFSQD